MKKRRLKNLSKTVGHFLLGFFGKTIMSVYFLAILIGLECLDHFEHLVVLNKHGDFLVDDDATLVI